MLVVFCPHAAFWHWFSVFFYFFYLIFFRNGFPNSLIVRSRSGFLFSKWKFFELYVRTCLLCFYFVAIFVTTIWRHNHFKSAFCSFVHPISTEVRVWRQFFVLSGASFSFAWLNSWSHLTYLTRKNDFLKEKESKGIGSKGCVSL